MAGVTKFLDTALKPFAKVFKTQLAKDLNKMGESTKIESFARS